MGIVTVECECPPPPLPPPPPTHRLWLAEQSTKGLSHWRRRRRDCRDWSVAATRATRETKKWLALSPGRRRRDWSVRRGDSGDQNMACALTSRRRLRDLLETEKVSPPKIKHVWISCDSPETRLVSRRRRGDVSATSGDSSRHLVAT